MCVSKPKPPKMPDPQPIPDRQAERAPSVQATVNRAQEKLQRRSGYASMILTPKAGLGAPSTTGGATLLGG